jgi:hypothetical protein
MVSEQKRENHEPPQMYRRDDRHYCTRCNTQRTARLFIVLRDEPQRMSTPGGQVIENRQRVEAYKISSRQRTLCTTSYFTLAFDFIIPAANASNFPAEILPTLEF